MRFMCYFLDYVSAIMTSNVDQAVLINDMQDFNSSHFSMELMRAAIEVSGVSTQLYLLFLDFVLVKVGKGVYSECRIHLPFHLWDSQAIPTAEAKG